MAKNRLQPFRRLDQFGEVQSRIKAGTLQHVDDILRGDIARRGRCKRTPANPAAAGIDNIYALFDRRGHIGEGGAASVVEMHAQEDIRRFHHDPLDQRAHLPGGGDTDRIAKRQLTDSGALGPRSKIGHNGRVDFPVKRIAKGDRNRCR